jgi:hypothetical protein
MRTISNGLDRFLTTDTQPLNFSLFTLAEHLRKILSSSVGLKRGSYSRPVIRKCVQFESQGGIMARSEERLAEIIQR